MAGRWKAAAGAAGAAAIGTGAVLAHNLDLLGRRAGKVDDIAVSKVDDIAVRAEADGVGRPKDGGDTPHTPEPSAYPPSSVGKQEAVSDAQRKLAALSEQISADTAARVIEELKRQTVSRADIEGLVREQLAASAQTAAKGPDFKVDVLGGKLTVGTVAKFGKLKVDIGTIDYGKYVKRASSVAAACFAAEVVDVKFAGLEELDCFKDELGKQLRVAKPELISERTLNSAVEAAVNPRPEAPRKF